RPFRKRRLGFAGKHPRADLFETDPAPAVQIVGGGRWPARPLHPFRKWRFEIAGERLSADPFAMDPTLDM
ncbi:unnamed protein product, partial [Dibothriocephalus latus]